MKCLLSAFLEPFSLSEVEHPIVFFSSLKSSKVQPQGFWLPQALEFLDLDIPLFKRMQICDVKYRA